MISLLPNIEYLVASSTYAGRDAVAVKLLLNKSPNCHEGRHRRSLAYVFPGISHVIHPSSWRDCPKSPRGVHNSALGATETMLFGPFWPPYTGHIHAQSVASTLFGQSQKSNSRKFAVASDPSSAPTSTPQRHGVSPSASNSGDYVAFVAPLCSKPLRLATARLPENFLR